jgi:hypothetical protein
VRFTTDGSPRWGWPPFGFASGYRNCLRLSIICQKPENSDTRQPQTFAAAFFLKKVDFFALFLAYQVKHNLFAWLAHKPVKGLYRVCAKRMAPHRY